MIKRDCEIAVDVGCAEGYYTVGLARVFKDKETKVLAYDINKKAYLYKRGRDGHGGESAWEEVRVVESSVTLFGQSVGIYGNYAIVGGTGDTSDQGIVNIYQNLR